MGLRCIEQDQIEFAVDHRADRAAAPPQLVVVEMLVVELESVGAEERPRLQRQSAEIDRAARPDANLPGRLAAELRGRDDGFEVRQGRVEIM